MKNILAFAIGATIGSVTTWILLKSKYDKRMQDETSELRNYYKNRYADRERDTNETESSKIEPKIEFDSITKDYTIQDMEVDKKMDRPYVISPDEYNEEYGYRAHTLVYYADHVLVDDNDDIVDNAEDIIGLDSLNHFGEYEDDSVFVRNDKLKCDYEILKDERTYSEAMSKKPYHKEH